MSASKKKANIKGKETIEKYAPPPVENLILNEDILFDLSLKNEYQTICGAIDAGTHPLTVYILEQNLFNKHNHNGKTAFDLAASLGNKEFIRTLLERMGDRLDDTQQPFNIKQLVKQSNAYNFMHHACIWGRLDLCKLLIENTKLVNEPVADDEFTSKSIDTFRSNKTNTNIPNSPVSTANLKTLSSVLLKSRCKTGETPLQLAKRYHHIELIEFLSLAEKKQFFMDMLIDIKQFSNDPEKNLNKLSKDDKVTFKKT